MQIAPFLILPLIVVLYLLNSIKILAEYERGVIFRLGKLLPQPKGPGLVFVFAPIDRMVRVGLRTVVLDVPPQDVITRDNVSVKVNAVVYFRVMDSLKAIVEVENYNYATSQLSQTTLRSVLGQVDLDDLLSKREHLNQELQQILENISARWRGRRRRSGKNAPRSSTPRVSSMPRKSCHRRLRSSPPNRLRSRCVTCRH